MSMRARVVVTGVAVLLAGSGLTSAIAGCAGPDASAPSPRESTVRTVRGVARASAVSIARPSPVRPAPSAATGAPVAKPGSPPRITVRRTGGFAGVDQTLVVRPDGVWAWDGPDQGGGPRGGRLTAAQRAELARLAGSPALAAEARQKPGPPQCADGFDYVLTAGSLTVSWVDCDPVTPPTAVAITKLLAAATPL